jgi:molybdopterin converting factor subunit 1
MRVCVKLFAVARQRVGRDVVELDVPGDATILALRGALAENYPVLKDVLPHVRFAVNSEYAADGQLIPAAAEVALIPPVSGG